MHESNETIVACATAIGRAGIAIIRISGVRSFPLVRALTRQQVPAPRIMAIRDFYTLLANTDLPLTDEGGSNDRIDRGMVVAFPGPASYSGEDMAEFHCHGSTAVIAALLAACCEMPGVRLAQPGEFTRRAVLAGKQNIYQAEALLDLIDAETQEQRKLAIHGQYGHPLATWRGDVENLLAEVEADIDFGESEDLATGNWQARIQGLRQTLSGFAEDRRGRAIRDGIRIVLYGAPNVGKSSLYNRLLSREAALVSSLPGTTRDRLEAVLDIAGFKVLLSDTAGLHQTSDQLEKAGVERTYDALNDADVAIFITSVDNDRLLADRESLWDIPCKTALKVKDTNGARTIPHLFVVNKKDIEGSSALDEHWPDDAIHVSARFDQGIETLYMALANLLRQNFAVPPTSAVVTRQRHHDVLIAVLKALELAEQEPNIELLAEHLRAAYRTLDHLTYRGGVETVLDRIFMHYCIGK